MASVNVTIRLDSELKQQADELFGDLGLSLNSALNMFIKQSVREQRIPFEVKRNPSPLTLAKEDTISSISQKLITQNRQAYEELAK